MDSTVSCQTMPGATGALRCGPELPGPTAGGAPPGLSGAQPGEVAPGAASAPGSGEVSSPGTSERLDGERRAGEPKLMSTMELFRDVVSKQLGREQALVERRRAVIAEARKGGDGSLEDFRSATERLTLLQDSYYEKSLSGAIILSTGRSAENFCKTLMRSQ